MRHAVLEMKSFLKVKPGMRIYYDCPYLGDDYQSTMFFRKYRKCYGVISELAELYVGLLDRDGRRPGVYIDPNRVRVRFDGEKEEHTLGLQFLVVLSKTTTVEIEKPLRLQRARDLPEAIRFYPGDVVVKKGDPTSLRTVVDVKLDEKGNVSYILSETPEHTAAREKERADKEREIIEKEGQGLSVALFRNSPSYPRTEHVSVSELRLKKRENLYYLYEKPSKKLVFASAQEELEFFAKSGISSSIYPKNHSVEWSLESAASGISKGEGDFFLKIDNRVRTLKGEPASYELRKLLPRFRRFRKRLKTLSLAQYLVKEGEAKAA